MLWIPLNLVDHTLNVLVKRGAKLVSEWEFELAADDGGKLYHTELGNGMYPFDVEASNGARVDLGVPRFGRGVDIWIEQQMFGP